MKIVLDTNIYVSWIRERKYAELLLDVRSQKYLSSYVLMELWSGAKTKKASRIVEKLQKPYMKAHRIILPQIDSFVTVGQILSDITGNDKVRLKDAGFINDICIGMNAASIGAHLFTNNKSDFELISTYLKNLKVNFV